MQSLIYKHNPNTNTFNNKYIQLIAEIMNSTWKIEPIVQKN